MERDVGARPTSTPAALVLIDRLFLDSNPFDAGPADPIALTVHA